MRQAEVCDLKFLVPRCDTAELFGLTKQALDPIPLPVPSSCPGRMPTGRGPGWPATGCWDLPPGSGSRTAVGPVEPLVPDDLVHRDALDGAVEYRHQQRGVASLAGSDVHRDHRILVGHRRDDLGAQPTPAAPQRLRLRRALGPDLLCLRRTGGRE